MGTWGAPQTKQERAFLRQKTKELKKLRMEIESVFGDDQVLDAFGTLEDRLKVAVKHVWSKTDHRTDDCKHPAFYGKAPGVCTLCRLNLTDDEDGNK